MAFPDSRIGRVDADTIKDPDHPCYQFTTGDINKNAQQFDVLICSPTVETGISINEYHFDVVFGIAQGSQTVNSFLQSIERYRANVPRHIYARSTGTQSLIGGGFTTVEDANNCKDKFKEEIGAMLGAMMSLNDGLDSNINRIYLNTWIKYAAINNQRFYNYRESIYQQLRDQGYNLTEKEAIDKKEQKFIKETVNKNQEDNFWKRCEDVANSSEELCDQIRRENTIENSIKKELTKEKRDAIEKIKICDSYGVTYEQVTPELVKKNREGMYDELMLYLYLVHDHTGAIKRDKRVYESLQNDKWEVFLPDMLRKQKSININILHEIRFPFLLRYLSLYLPYDKDDPLIKQFHSKAKQYKDKIKRHFGISVGEDPIKFVGSLLRKVGYDHEGKQVRKGKKVKRTYTLVDKHSEHREPFVNHHLHLNEMKQLQAESEREAREKWEQSQQEPVSQMSDDSKDTIENDLKPSPDKGLNLSHQLPNIYSHSSLMVTDVTNNQNNSFLSLSPHTGGKEVGDGETGKNDYSPTGTGEEVEEEMTYQVGEAVFYWEDTVQAWRRATVEAIKDGAYKLSVGVEDVICRLERYLCPIEQLIG